MRRLPSTQRKGSVTMSWSMDSISFRMAGSGSWQNALPDAASRQLYSKIYPAGVPLSQVDDKTRQIFQYWEKAAIIRIEDQEALPLGPVMTDEDLCTLNPWFQDISDFMCTTVLEHLPQYHALVPNLAGGKSVPRQMFDNILTIQICALTLDSWVFAMLREKLIGIYPPRDFAGNFFFWGYAFGDDGFEEPLSPGPERIFGFTTYGWWRLTNLHVIRSHGLDRSAIKDLLRRRDILDYLHALSSTMVGRDELGSGEQIDVSKEKAMVEALHTAQLLKNDQDPAMSIPIFNRHDMTLASQLYNTVAGKIMNRFMAEVNPLEDLISKCSFARCSGSDVLCMLFHLAYSYAADKLVEKETIPDFPKSAGGEWGVWMH